MCGFIDAQRADSDPDTPDDLGKPGLSLLCRVLDVPRSTYYAWKAARPAAQERQDAEDELADEIRAIHTGPGSRGAYGAPRIHAELRRRGRTVNKKKVVRIMAERDIHGITRRKRRGLTKPDRKAAPAPDLVGRDFTAPRSGVKLVGDITFLPTLQGWWYLATVLDLGTREIIGYAMADHHRAELVTDALRMAASRGELQPGCIMHSDRGRVHLRRIPPGDTGVGAETEHGTNRLML